MIRKLSLKIEFNCVTWKFECEYVRVRVCRHTIQLIKPNHLSLRTENRLEMLSQKLSNESTFFGDNDNLKMNRLMLILLLQALSVEYNHFGPYVPHMWPSNATLVVVCIFTYPYCVNRHRTHRAYCRQRGINTIHCFHTVEFSHTLNKYTILWIHFVIHDELFCCCVFVYLPTGRPASRNLFCCCCCLRQFLFH